MRYFGPLRRLDGRWEYASLDRRRGSQATGYCHAAPTWTPAEVAAMGVDPARLEHALGDRTRYHTDGHATPAEARACYQAYLLDTKLAFYASSGPAPCAVCGGVAAGGAEIAGGVVRWSLCADHRTRAAVAALLAGLA